MTMRFAAPIVLTASLLFGCTGDGEDDLDVEPSSTVDAQAELAERVAELEQRLDQAPDVELPDLQAIEQRIDDALETLDGLREEMDLDRDARLGFAERVDDVEADLRNSLADLRDELQAIRAEIADLEIRYQVLQERIDRMDRGG